MVEPHAFGIRFIPFQNRCDLYFALQAERHCGESAQFNSGVRHAGRMRLYALTYMNIIRLAIISTIAASTSFPQNPQIKIEARTTFFYAAQDLSFQEQRPVCLEVLQGSRDLLPSGEVSLDKLRNSGFEVHRAPKSLLIRSSGLNRFEAIPLDRRVKGLIFSGTLGELKTQLMGYFPMKVSSGHNRLDEALQAQQVTVNIKEELSLRELLLKIAVEADLNVSVIYKPLPAGEDDNEKAQKIGSVMLIVVPVAERSSK